MSATFDLTRRSFLKVSGAVGVGLVLGCRLEASADDDFAPNAFVHIAPDSTVTITVAKPDIGTGVRTALAMVVAEELGVDWQAVKVRQAPAGGQYGGQGVGGSGSVRATFGPLRYAGAAARMMLIQAATQKWGGGPIADNEVRIENGMVIHSSGKSVKLGELATAAAKLPVPERSTITLKNKADFKIIGKPTKRVDNKDVVTGKAKYGLDSKVPKMKYAVIARPRVFGGSVTSFDDTEAKKIAGFVKAVQIGNGVAVIADSTWAALSARKALQVVWNDGENATFNSEELTKRFKAAVTPAPAMPAEAKKTITANYELPYLSHCPMEPQNCTIHFKGDSAEVWVPTQQPEGVQRTVAQALGLTPDKVDVHITLVGGGFGRRLSVDYAAEAAAIVKVSDGPIQLVWSREDDLCHDFYRPATCHTMTGALDGNNLPVAFYHSMVQAGGGRRGGDAAAPTWRAMKLGYKVPNGGFVQTSAQSPVPTGAWRSVENTHMSYVMECFFDELCTAGGKDPVQARLAMCDDERLKKTLTMAAEKADWGKPMPKGWGRGVACFVGYGSYITQIAEVEIVDDEPKVRRIVAVVDCGLVINPLGMDAQIQGATMDAVATLLHSAITIDKGGAVEDLLGDFGWARITDAPKMETYVIAEADTPGGLGEVGYPAAGPAVANAIAAATGKRLRKLPLKLSELE